MRSKASSRVTGSLRRFQEENESANCTVLSERKKKIKAMLHIFFSYGAVGNFMEGTVLYLSMDSCPIKLSLFHFLFGKSTDGCDRLRQGHYITELRN